MVELLFLQKTKRFLTKLSRRGQSPLVRTPSPRRGHHMHHDIGFSDTVSNVVEIVKEEHRRGRPYGHGHRFARGRNHTFILAVPQIRCCVFTKNTNFPFQHEQAKH